MYKNMPCYAYKMDMSIKYSPLVYLFTGKTAQPNVK